MRETVPENRRLYLVLAPGENGRKALCLSTTPPKVGTAQAVLIVRGVIMDGPSLNLSLVSDVTEEPAVKSLKSTTLLGTITLAQTAVAALAAGLRTIGVTVPVSMGLKAGDPVIVIPTVRLVGYAIHDAVASSATLVSITMTAPALALNQSYSLPCRLIRLNI